MRTILLIILGSFLLPLQAEQFMVFEKAGLYGLRNEEGEIMIPPIYDEVGWSSGAKNVHRGVIGIRKNKKWGLISVRNKPVSEIIYHSLEPLESENFKASVRGKFSNHLFFGVLDKTGRVVVSFNYFSIERFEDQFLVSSYDPKAVRYGLISKDEKVQVPLKYRSVTKEGNFILGETLSYEIDIYLSDGGRLERNIDSIKHTPRGLICYEEGFVGFYETNGNQFADFAHKKIVLENDVILTYPFPSWEILKGTERMLTLEADSLQLFDSKLLIAYNNGAHHFTLSDSVFTNTHYKIQARSKDHLIVKNGQANEWSVIGYGGQVWLSGYDSIVGNEEVYWAKKEESWQLFSRYGKPRNKLKASILKQGVSGQYVVKINKNWGIISQYGLDVTPFKYEEIVPVNDGYSIKYLNKWGIMNERGDWELYPEFTEVFFRGDFRIGRKGLAYTYHSNDLFWRSTSKPLTVLGEDYLVIKYENGLKGLLNDRLKKVIPSAFKKVELIGNYFAAYTDSTCSLYNKQGSLVINPFEDIQEITSFGEHYLLARKDNRWGFWDEKGRMRISNRYEDAEAFSEGFAPIKLRGHWGFIDKKEKLVIQPFYDGVSAFKNGLSIVSVGSRKGLINTQGKKIVDILWKDIIPTPFGKFIVINEANQYGLLSETGQFLLRPNFEFLEDKGDRVIVAKYGKKGILEYSGKELYQITYDEIKISGDFIFLKH